MNIAYVITVRYPSERAHALYVSLVLDAFKTLGHSVSVIVPRRFGRNTATPRAFYGLSNDVELHTLPTIDTTYIPLMDRFAYLFYTSTFIFSLFFYVLLHNKKDTLFFTNEMIVAYVLAKLGKKVVYEVHDYPSGHISWYRSTFERVAFILVNTDEKKKDLEKEYDVESHKIIVAHNGVDFKKFNSTLSKEQARTELSLPEVGRIVLYTGSLFAWKGVDMLAEAVKGIDVDAYFVGGNETDGNAFTQKHTSIENIHVHGHEVHSRMPLWLRAADVLVIPNSAKNAVSERHTSPMKLFEYMASGTPIVASDVFSLREILKEGEGYFVPPDDEVALRTCIQNVLGERGESSARATKAQEHAKSLSWTARAESILIVVQ